MPHVQIMTPTGHMFRISTRQTETILKAWFDEVLPWAYYPEDQRGPVVWPRIDVWPMWAWALGTPRDFDWLTDSRVLGRMHDFPASDGEQGLKELAALRQRLEAELRGYGD